MDSTNLTLDIVKQYIADAEMRISSKLLDAVFPIGGFYVNRTNDTDPAVLLGFGVWAKVQDKMLMAKGSTHTADGGSSTHTHPLSSNGAARVAFGSLASYIKSVNNPSGANWTAQYRISNTRSADSTAVSVGAELEGATDSASSIPPMIVVHIWERIE